MPAAQFVQISTCAEEHRDHLQRRRAHFTTAFACLLQPLVTGLAVLLGSTSHAGLLVTIEPSGSNVTATLSGSFATLPTPGTTGNVTYDPTMNPSTPFIEFNDTIGSSVGSSGLYNFASSFPAFGTGGAVTADATTANTRLNVGVSRLQLVQSYTLGTPFSGSMTWNNASIASLGLTPGVYSRTLSGGDAGATVTINVVPEPSSIAMLGFAGIAAMVMSVMSRKAAGTKESPADGTSSTIIELMSSS